MNATIFLLAAVSAFSLDRFSLTQHLEDKATEDMKPTKALATYAAQGEFESESFSLLSDADVKALDIVPTDLVSDGAKIAADAVDVKVVKVVWKYPTAWMSIKQRPTADAHALIPCMLVHDDALIRRDDKTMANYLRGDYEGGVRYMNMSLPNAEKFNDNLHPVRDAKKFVPCPLPKGVYRQFWLTLKTPADAKPGVYRGKVKLVADGREALALDWKHTVHPFQLPLPRTHRDLSKRFIVSMMGGPDLAQALKDSRDLAQAETKVRNVARTAAEHGVFDISAGSPMGDLSDDDLGIRCAILLRQGGLPLQHVFAGTAVGEAFGRKFENDKPYEEVHPEEYVKDRQVFGAYAKNHVAGWRKVAPDATIWTYASDEGSLWTERRQFQYWHEMQMAGGSVVATCWRDVAHGSSWILNAADVAERCDPETPRFFQPAGARVFTYASPFLAPDQPSYTRNGKGIAFWRNNWDGLFEYVFTTGENRWNETYLFGGVYRQMGIVYPVQDGVVSTLAFEGFREGIDDVRYFTLLGHLSAKALASSDAATKAAGRAARVWLERRIMGKVGSLEVLRLEVAERIVGLQAKVGPYLDKPWPAVPELKPDGFAAKCPEKDATKRAAWFSQQNRDDLAQPEYEKAAADASGTTADRVARKIALGKFYLSRLRRPSAEKTLEEALALADADAKAPQKVRQDAVRALFAAYLTPQVYMERFPAEQIAKAEKLQATTTERKHALPPAERARMVQRVASAYVTSETPGKAVEIADKVLEDDVSANDATRAALMLISARAQQTRGEAKDGWRRIEKAFRYAPNNRWQPDLKTAFELAQAADDADGVQRYGAAYAATLDKQEQADIIKHVVDTMNKFTSKKKSSASAAPAAPADDEPISLDE